jgi:hypothetical protein
MRLEERARYRRELEKDREVFDKQYQDKLTALRKVFIYT